VITVLSFDVEEWYQGVPVFTAADCAARGSTLEEEFDLIATELAHAGRSATFFVLAEVARSHPRMVRRIAEAGWEVASHGSGHRCVYETSPAEFRESLRRSVREIEDVSGVKVRGYRAPMWSLGPGVEWAVEAMLAEGIEYDSSVFPMGRRDPRGPFLLRSGGGVILEVPPMPVRVGGLFCPLASGVCLRCFPAALYPALVRHEARRSGYLHVYLHPWEFSRRSRHLAGLAPARRLYFNVGRRGAYAKFRRFVRDLAFASVAEQMESIHRMAAEARSLDEITCYRAAYTRSKWSYSETFLALLRHFAS
jgi:polysaccharide deacetylase family protein (PEP-CTERM system associated)